MRCCLVLFFLIYSLSLFGQRYAFISFSTPEGLPQSQVNAITQDSSGYLWVGTLGGLAKFNGNKFINYSTGEGLLSNRINYLTIIDNALFVGHDNGISYQCARDSFSYAILPKNKSTVNVTGIVTFNNSIYVTTNGQGVFMLDKKNQSLSHINNSPERIRGATILNNTIFLATRTGIFSLDSKHNFNYQENFPDGSYSSIKTHDDRLVATTFEGELFVSKKPFKKSSLYYKSENHRFRDAYISNNNAIWLNSKHGVLKISDNDTIELNEQSGLAINDVSVIFKDREHNIWIGTGGKGLLKFSGETFTHFDKKNGLPSDLIISTLEDKNGFFWLSTFDKGVYKMKFKNEIEFEQVDYLSKSTVWSSVSTNNKLFFGSIFGLHSFDGISWKSYYKEDGLPANKITGLYKRKNGELLIGTAEGIVIYENGIIKPYNHQNQKIINARDFIDKNDTLFIGAQIGLYGFYNDSLIVNKQFDGGVNSIAEDKEKKLWIGTENGLFIKNKMEIKHFPLDNRSGSDYINFIIPHESCVFVGTNNGLYEVNIASNEIIHYGINSGLVDLETNLNSAFIDSKANLWFGTAAGLIKMDLSKKHFLIPSAKPKLHLLNITVNFENILLDKDLLINTENSDYQNLNLKYKNNNISFEFDGIYLTNPSGITYTYKLDGFTDEWSPPSSNRNISFTNLPSGNYSLRVKAISRANIYSDEYTFNFTIDPPFYQTWWFYSFMLVIIAFVLIVIDKIRTKRIERKNYQLNLEFKNKLAQLEQQSLNASMNRHFIFNSLNSIQYFINASDKTSANKYLMRFAKLIRKNLDSSHQKNGMVSLQDELERLTLYLELESMRFHDKFDYSIKVDNKVETEILQVPAMFLQPFVENSIIHGVLPLVDKKGEIKITVSDHLDHIRIEVFDNGIGIDKSIGKKKQAPGDHESQGMMITKGRIELLQKISARSIELIGPRQINENDSSIKGTLVTFKILKQYLV